MTKDAKRTTNRAATARRALKLGLTVVVLGFVARHALMVRRDLAGRHLGLHPDPAWLGGAAALYLAGLVAFGCYFWRVMGRGATPVGFYAALRAYLVSHLAKYVPGKAMVVVVRSALVAEAGARPATAAFATLYETLTMMAAGGLVAAAGFGLAPAGPTARLALAGGRAPVVPLALVGLLAGAGFLVLVGPGVFPRLAGLIRAPLRGVGADALPRLSAGLLVEGLAWGALGWVLLGLSQAAAIAGIGLAAGPGLWAPCVASVALATVAGFAVPIAPGGLGVREWVLWTALTASLDGDWAVVAALVLRLVWGVAEVMVAVALFLIRPRPRPSLP